MAVERMDVVRTATKRKGLFHVVRIKERGMGRRRHEGETACQDIRVGSMLFDFLIGDFHQLNVFLRGIVGEADEIRFVPDFAVADLVFISFGEFRDEIPPEIVVRPWDASFRAVQWLPVLCGRPDRAVIVDGLDFDALFAEEIDDTVERLEIPAVLRRLHEIPADVFTENLDTDR